MARSAANRSQEIASAKQRLLRHISDDQALIEEIEDRRRHAASARGVGATWGEIASAAGLSAKQSAYQRFGLPAKKRQVQVLDELESRSLFDD